MTSFTQWFRGLRGKLLLTAIFPVCAFVAISALNIRGLSKTDDMLDESYSDVVPSLDHLGHMQAQRFNIGNDVWIMVANFENKDLRKEYAGRLSHSLEEFKKHQDSYEETPFTDEEAKTYAAVKTHKETFRQLGSQLLASLAKNSPEGDQEARKLFFEEWRPLANELSDAVDKNIALYEELAKKNAKIKAELFSQNLNMTVFASAFAIFALLGLLMWTAQKMARTVGGIAGSLTESGSSVTGAIQQLTSAGQNLSQTATAAAASLEETVASLEEISSMVKMNSDNAKQAATLSQSSRDSAEQGEKEIQNLISSMKDISQSSKKIEEIITVIDDIAFQTNLLALNAAVEAARAGEQGKGFAVVADAVRTLAQRSAVAAKDIANLIKDSVGKIEHGTSIADRSGTVLNNIVTSVKKVADLNNEIAAASTEQSAGISQVGKAMNSLDQSSQNNASSAEEIAATAEELLNQSKVMQSTVGDLNMAIIGVATPVAHAAAPTKSSTVAAKNEKKTAAPKSAAKPVPSSGKVIAFDLKKSSPSSPKITATKNVAANMIPFDEDEEAPATTETGGRAKLGTTDGF
jgi:methyl-accepting chemotaxis protein